MGNKGLHEERTERHESYGMASISRTSSSGTFLFGSIARHNSYITLRISQGYVRRHLANDWYSADSLPIIEINMSHTQFGELITSHGIGGGVPCTIHGLNGKVVKSCPEPEPVTTKFEDDLKATTVELVKDLRGQIQKIEETLLPGNKGMGKTELREVLDGIKRSFMTITDSLPFIEKSFHEELQDQTNKALGEIEAVAVHMVDQIGMRAIAEKAAASPMPQFAQTVTALPQLTDGKEKK